MNREICPRERLWHWEFFHLHRLHPTMISNDNDDIYIKESSCVKISELSMKNSV